MRSPARVQPLNFSVIDNMKKHTPKRRSQLNYDRFIDEIERNIKIEDDFVLVNDNKEGFIKSYEQSYWNQHKDDK